MPLNVRDGVESWAKVNADYKCRLWNGEQSLDFLHSHFSAQIVELFAKSTIPAFKSDLIRYALLYVYGGIYVDADTKAQSPLTPTFPRRARLILTYADRADAGLATIVKNDFIAARSGNQVFLEMLDRIYANCEAAQNSSKSYNIHSLSGPSLLKSVVKDGLGGDIGAILALPRLDAKAYFAGLKVNYDEIGGHWSIVQRSQRLFE